MRTLEFSSVGHNIDYLDRDQSFKSHAVLGAISASAGLLHYKVYPGAVQQQQFKEFMKELKDK